LHNGFRKKEFLSMQIAGALDLEQLITTMPGAAYWIDRNNVYQACNDLQALVFGLKSKHDIVGKKNSDLNNRTPEIYDNQHLTVMKNQKTQIFEEMITLTDGSYAMVLSHKIPLFDTTGQVIGLMGMWFDPVIQNDIQQTIRVYDTAITHEIQVLVVEDQRFAADVTKIILNELHCEVQIASSASAARQYAKTKRFDLILMDIGLPDSDGYAATQWIRTDRTSLNRRVPIIALTALADDQDKDRCLESGMNAILIKPIYRNKAIEILDIFVPKAVNQTKIIDLEKGAEMFNGNTELAKKMIGTLIADLDTEIDKLDQSYKAKNWDLLEAGVHKLRGGISYCGTPRLQEACARLEDHLHAGYHELAPLLYKQLLKEIGAVKANYDSR
jgi:CheY-like chemotaxis protein